MRTRRLPDPGDIWTSDDAGNVLGQWRESGESIAVFARRHGIDPARLYWWRKRLTSSRLTLLPATLVTAATASSRTAAVTIRFGDRIAVEVADASPGWVAELVAELERSRP